MNAERIAVDVPGGSYEVCVGAGLLGTVGSMAREVSGSAAIAMITDETVAERYGIAVDASLARVGFSVTSLTVPPGESSKSWHVAGEVLEAVAAQRLDRTGLIVALGGGVVGDLGGFVSAVYLRGVDFIQVPTTLLAMVDSSVGGKTGVDLRAGKNLAGAFKQPLLVIADTDVLSTLPDDEWRSGLAEVVKSAVLSGEEFLSWVETHIDGLAARTPDVVAEAICRSVRFKAAVVAEDEREAGDRECLNYGHTLGHALEKALGYGTVSHGAAVAEGLRFAARVSVEVVGTDAAFVRRQDKVLDALGLGPLEVELQPRVLLDLMHGDKKSREGRARMVLVAKPGVWSCEAVPDGTALEHLDAWAESKLGGD